jgi:hypothetical protein
MRRTTPIRMAQSVGSGGYWTERKHDLDHAGFVTHARTPMGLRYD